MTLPLVVFAGVFGIVWGAYYLLVMRDENQLLARLQPKRRQSRTRGPDVLKPEEALSSVDSLNRVLSRIRVAGPLQRFLYQSGMKQMTVSVFLLMTGCLGVGAFWLLLMSTRNILLAAILAVVVGSGPTLFVRYKRNKRLGKFEEQFPEAVDLVARALRAGHALPTGLGMVADELRAPVGTEFRILFDEQNFGLTLPDALRNFAKRVPVIDARFFVTAVLTQREAGGNLAEVLDNLSAVIRERFKIKRQLRVISAHGRLTGAVLGALPPTLGLFLMIRTPKNFQILFEEPAGIQMLIVAVALQLLGAFMIYRITKVDY
jgi:tight adherence protein B